MKEKYSKIETEVDVVFSISGRLRLKVNRKPNDPAAILKKLKQTSAISKGSYNGAIDNFIFVYDNKNGDSDLEKIILNFCGFYSADLGVREIKVNYKLSKHQAMGYSSLVSLGFIILDLGVNFAGVGNGVFKYANFIRWCAVGTTIGAIFEHGYKELSQKGAFDPEVMSIMYLFNTINKSTITNATVMTSSASRYSPIIAWVLTFGRHILTRQNRAIIISTVEKNGELKVVEENNKNIFFKEFVGSFFDAYQNVNVRRSIVR